MKHNLAFLFLALTIHAAEPVKIAPATETAARLHADGQGWKLDKAKITDPKLPRVLLIGDSIVGGYRQATIAALEGRDDFYTLLVYKRALARGDRFHWTPPAYKLLADMCIESILKALPAAR